MATLATAPLGGLVSGAGLSGVNWSGNSPFIDPLFLQQMQQMQQMASNTLNTNRFTDSNMAAMLQYRMGWNMGAPRCSFDRCYAYRLNEEKAVVFILNKGQAQLIEDDLQLFPSDTLVTQLRLLENA